MLARHPRTLGRSRLLALVLAGASGLGAALAAEADASAAATETFEVVVRAYCVDPTNPCGYGDEATFRDAWFDAFDELNEIWRPTGISFHPTFDFVYGEDVQLELYDLDEEKVAELKAVAAANPGAITLFVIPSLGGGFSAIPWTNGPPPIVANEWYGFFACCPDGKLLAHELGHHFCLHHTFTFADPGAPNVVADHEGDGCTDTPPDPAPIESVPATADAETRAHADLVLGDGSIADAYNPWHEWCEVEQHDNDWGSPQPYSCTPSCVRYETAGTVPTAHAPATNIVMSYYLWQCSGPWVVDGERTEAWSGQQLQRIAECRAVVPERQQLVDICEAAGGDTDHDGLCDSEDNCPQVSNSEGADLDGDGVGDVCLSCAPGGTTIDTDLDGFADDCDLDDDNDGCEDDVDQDPTSPKSKAGVILQPGCGTESPLFTYAGNDSDGDGAIDCADEDDDDDGIPDDEDLCNDALRDCFVVDDCWPTPTCFGPGCSFQLDLVLVSMVQPDDPFTFEAWQLDETGGVWIAPQDPYTLSEMARALTGRAFGEAAEEGLRLELRRDGRTLDVLAEYRPGDVALGEIERGVAIRFARHGERFSADAVWGAGLRAGDSPPDFDRDGWPDAVDVCTLAADPEQTDSDADGYGNACDADFDGDGRVSTRDRARIEACLGVDVVAPPPFSESTQTFADGVSPAFARNLELARCRSADLNGNGVVDELDLEIAWNADAPGPSAHGAPALLTRDADRPDTLAAADDAEADADDDGATTEGCGCRTGRSSSLWLVLPFGVAMATRRRRRVARRKSPGRGCVSSGTRRTAATLPRP